MASTDEQLIQKLVEELNDEIINGPDPVGVHQTPSQILPQLYLGALYDAQDVEKLRKLGITHVLNMAHVLNTVDGTTKLSNELNIVVNFFEPHGIQYKGLHAFDFDSFDISKYFDETYTFILQAINSNAKVLVNCAAGVCNFQIIADQPTDFKICNHCGAFHLSVLSRSHTRGRCSINKTSNSLCTTQKTCHQS